MTITDKNCQRYVIQEVDLLDYLRCIEKSIDGDTEELWETLEQKLEETVKHRPYIIDSLERNGWTQPIVCYIAEFAWFADEPTFRWWQGNGNHRLAAAIALGMETVLVAFAHDDWMLEELTC